MPNQEAIRSRRAALAATAAETKAVLPDIVKQLPHLQPSRSENLNLDDLPALDPADCPRFRLPGGNVDKGGRKSYGTLVKVVNSDSFEAALQMPTSAAAVAAHQDPDNRDEEKDKATPASSSSATTERSSSSNKTNPNPNNHRVAVLNLASAKNPGGGWLRGSSAQEEALCYRSSLSLSLHKSYYPWSPLTALYTRDVVIIRSAMSSSSSSSSSLPSSSSSASVSSTTGHHRLLVPQTAPADLPVVSVISVAAVKRPLLSSDGTRFARPADRDLTRNKMRLALRVAARRGHELLVLGALGCGAYGNPPREVAGCWLEVLGEDEFRGGWWRAIWFAVLDTKGEGNFAVFDEVLGGKEVGRVDEE